MRKDDDRYLTIPDSVRIFWKDGGDPVFTSLSCKGCRTKGNSWRHCGNCIVKYDPEDTDS